MENKGRNGRKQRERKGKREEVINKTVRGEDDEMGKSRERCSGGRKGEQKAYGHWF